MKRRHFLAMLSALGVPGALVAQPKDPKVYKIRVEVLPESESKMKIPEDAVKGDILSDGGVCTVGFRHTARPGIAVVLMSLHCSSGPARFVIPKYLGPQSGGKADRLFIRNPLPTVQTVEIMFYAD